MPQLEFILFSDHFVLILMLLFFFFITFIGLYIYICLKSFCFNIFFDSLVIDDRI